MKKTYIKTWRERCAQYPHLLCVTDTIVKQTMQDEIDELRDYIRVLKLKLNVLVKELPLV